MKAKKKSGARTRWRIGSLIVSQAKSEANRAMKAKKRSAATVASVVKAKAVTSAAPGMKMKASKLKTAKKASEPKDECEWRESHFSQ